MKRRMSLGKRIGANLKRKATKAGHEFAYMAIWHEEVPKGRKTIQRRYK